MQDGKELHLAIDAMQHGPPLLRLQELLVRYAMEDGREKSRKRPQLKKSTETELTTVAEDKQ
jgi:hypothetical protein